LGLEEPNEIVLTKNSKSAGICRLCNTFRTGLRVIPTIPNGFFFMGEEDFASTIIQKKNWEIHYLPEVLVNHRVAKSRKDTDYQIRFAAFFKIGLVFTFYFIQ
jgi:hypothetical protein